MALYCFLQSLTPPGHRHPHRLFLFWSLLPYLLLVALILLAGCATSRSEVNTSPTPELTPTTGAEPKTTLTPTPTERLESAQADKVPTEADITITAVVGEVEPPGNLIILEKRTEGFRAIVLGDGGELVSADGVAMTLEEVRRGMPIQISGRGGEDGVLIAWRVVVLDDAPVTIPPPPPQPSPAPPTPISLSSVSPVWSSYDFPELGTSLSMPADWQMIRMPGGYFFGPIASANKVYRTQLTVSLKPNVPVELEAMTEALTQEWRNLTPRADFHTTSIMVGGVEGTAFWNLSPALCVDVYVPAHGLVHQINFWSTFCNKDRTQLNEVGQKILDSIQFYPATQNKP